MSANPPSLTPRQQEDAAASERRTPIGQRIIGPLLETLVSAWKRIKEPFCGFESGNEANYRRGLGRLPPSFGTRPNYDPLETMDVFWEHYRTEAEAADNELVKALGSDLDTLLIFAGLFSAINTAFIIEAYQDLKPDPAESGGTNDLLRMLVLATNQTLAIPPPTFSAPHGAVISNSLFFASLSLSLFAAFGAVLAKQWLSEYERVGEDRSAYIWGRQRHSKYLAMKRYRCETVIRSLGSALQISLFLFFVALAYWLWSINNAVACVVLAGMSIVLAFYFITTAISIADEFSPFSTRVSATLRKLLFRSRDDKLTPGVVCLQWLYENATSFPAIRAMADAWTHLSDPEWAIPHDAVSHRLLQAVASSDAITRGVTDGTLTTTLRSLQRVNPWRSSWLPEYTGESTQIDRRIIDPLLQCFEHAAAKHDLLMCDSVISALPGPAILLFLPRLKDDILIELLESPVTQTNGRFCAAAHLMCSPSIVSMSFRLDVPLSDSSSNSWQWRLLDALLKYLNGPTLHLAETAIDVPYVQLVFQISNHLGLTNSEETLQLWKAVYNRDLSRFPSLELTLNPLIRPDNVHSYGAGCRLLLHLWLCEQHVCGELSRWPVSQDQIFSMVEVTTKHGDLYEATGYLGALFIIGPLLWWHKLEGRFGTGTMANPRFLLKAVRHLSQAFQCDESKGQGLAPWIIPSVTDALSAYALSLGLEVPVPDRKPDPWRDFAHAALSVGSFARERPLRPEQLFQPIYTALKTALEVSRRFAGDLDDHDEAHYWNGFLEADAELETLKQEQSGIIAFGSSSHFIEAPDQSPTSVEQAPETKLEPEPASTRICTPHQPPESPSLNRRSHDVGLQVGKGGSHREE